MFWAEAKRAIDLYRARHLLVHFVPESFLGHAS